MEITIPAQRKRIRSFSETLILGILKNMTRGKMFITLPDGQEVEIGDGLSPITANIRIHRHDFFIKCMLSGDIGLGESYVDGDWDTDSIYQVISWFIINMENNPSISGSGLRKPFVNLFRFANQLYHRARRNNLSGSRKNISEHYDLGNDFYSLFLDRTMTYSSAIFRSADASLEAAQIEKYDRLCRILEIKSTDHVLEIGSGWGGFAVHAAKNYGCRVTTVTISEEQFRYAKARFEREALSGQIEIRLEDYRKVTGKYDKIVSIEMLEAVGHKYLPVYFAKCNELLGEKGSLALQVITSPDSRYDEIRRGVDFIQKHIFPGSLLPSMARINGCVNQTSDLTLFDIKDIGTDYARTLHAWYAAFNQQVDKIRALGMNDSFIRKWNYYLQYCEAAFATRNISTLQIVYARPNRAVLIPHCHSSHEN
jgi:cyclopropane-fatty-acyl-phospholipid synthase